MLETALEALSALPANQLLSAAEAAQLSAALSCLPAAARAGPLPVLLRRLSSVGSEPAVRMAADLWELYTEGELAMFPITGALTFYSCVVALRGHGFALAGINNKYLKLKMSSYGR